MPRIKPTKPASVLLLLALIVGLGACDVISLFTGNFPVWKAGQAKVLLIRDAQWGTLHKGIKRNGALLITDKNQLQEHEQLFLGNFHNGRHGCNYNYQIQFWASTDDLVGDIPFHNGCEEFYHHNAAVYAKMRAHIKQISTKPTHYIYNLKVPVTVDPETLKKFFAGTSLPVFFFEGKTDYFSSLTFTYQKNSKWPPIGMRPYPTGEYNAEERIKYGNEKRKYEKEHEQLTENEANLIVDETRKIIPVKDQSVPRTTHVNPWPPQGEKADKVEVTVKFANGADLTKVKELIIARGGKVENEHHPAHWFVQLVDTSDKLDVIKAKLVNYKFVEDVYEYPNRK